ncbi:MAG TPA: caspase family protein, partial [Pyrinomonadaceae bacterium]|nr:caspase family protein [Pyrinomonadaceae bacterium]
TPVKRALLAAALVLVAAVTAWPQTKSGGASEQPQTKKPITRNGLVRAVRINGLTVAELVQQIETRGVDFELTADAEQELREAGARPEVIAAVRANYRGAPARPTPPPAAPSDSPAAQPRQPDKRPTVPAPPPARLGTASYHALVIGNNAYQFMEKLRTAEADARAVEAVLREKYGFETRLLLNATRQEIVSALNSYRRALPEDSNLLIYYAGHGIHDREADKGYWLPVDARRDENTNWISADDITTNTKVIPAKHLLIVSDSCYSGTIYRGLEASLGAPSGRERFLQKMMSNKARMLMASGGNEPVADGGAGGHSVFAGALLRGLEEMEADVFTGAELFREYVQERVAGRANQTPEYNPLRNSGHDGGDFVFRRKR